MLSLFFWTLKEVLLHGFSVHDTDATLLGQDQRLIIITTIACSQSLATLNHVTLLLFTPGSYLGSSETSILLLLRSLVLIITSVNDFSIEIFLMCLTPPIGGGRTLSTLDTTHIFLDDKIPPADLVLLRQQLLLRHHCRVGKLVAVDVRLGRSVATPTLLKGCIRLIG